MNEQDASRMGGIRMVVEMNGTLGTHYDAKGRFAFYAEGYKDTQ